MPGAYLQSVAPLYISALELHSHETLLLHHCGRGCNAHVSLCAHRPTGCLADWLPDLLVGWLFDHLHYKCVFLTLLLQPCTCDPSKTGEVLARLQLHEWIQHTESVFRQNNFKISNCLVKGLYNYHCKQAEFFLQKDYRSRPCNLAHLSLLTFILLECGCKASCISSSNFRFQIVRSRKFMVFKSSSHNFVLA